MTDIIREITLWILNASMNIGHAIMTLCSWAIIALVWAVMAAVAVVILYFAWPVVLVGLAWYFVFGPMIEKALS